LALPVFLATGLFAAQEESEQVYRETTVAMEEEGYHHYLDSYVKYMPSRSVKAMPGEVEIIEADSEYSFAFKLFEQLPIKLSVEEKYYGINDTVGVSLPAHLTGLITDLETTLPFFWDNVYFRLGVSPSFLNDDWGVDSSSFRIPSRYYWVYKYSPKLMLLVGVAVYPEFEDEVLPILGFIYKPNDKWAFNIIPDRPNISYFLNEKITLFGEGGGTINEEFEVKRNSERGRVLRYKETHIGGGINYKFNRNIEATLSGGGMFGRSLRYADDQGKVVPRNGFYSEVRLQIKI
jgi:hypothetical protein